MKEIRESIEKLKQKGLLRQIPNIDYKNGNKIIINGKSYVNFASNDYLGIGSNLKLVDEFLNSNKNLFSSASARLLSGTSQEYKTLEKTLAEIFNKESALLFNTGYQCNLGVISSLCRKGDIVFSDKLNHASIIDGMKLSDGEFIRYKHLDYENLEEILIKKRLNYKRAIIVSESVFSMDGDCADIDKLAELKNKYNCLLMIDEAHAFCSCGETLAGLSFNKDVDIITATLGKAVGSFGAFCVANSDIINYLTNTARSFIFSTAIPPINISWTNWLLNYKRDFIKTQKEKLKTITDKTHQLLNECEIKTVSTTHIIPLIIGDNNKTLEISEHLKSLGYYIPAIRPPTVPEGSSRLRLSVNAETNFDDIKRILLCL